MAAGRALVSWSSGFAAPVDVVVGKVVAGGGVATARLRRGS